MKKVKLSDENFERLKQLQFICDEKIDNLADEAIAFYFNYLNSNALVKSFLKPSEKKEKNSTPNTFF